MIPGEQIEKQMEEAIEMMVRLYLSRVNPLFVHSNVPVVIDKLSESGIIAVFTGGARNVTNTILKKAGIFEKFHHISTCDDAPTRNEIVKHAIEKASLGRKFDKVFVIGDSPEDIEAAKANNAIAVTLATSHYSKEELTEAGADIVFDDWKDTNWILEKLK
jgi:phosphoglycolate phosphatase-like HAD superfamily hydrolase